ncbi:MAG: cytidylate kinase [Rhodopirellula sp.]|nr:cytidylate kinase [Rhodopirellula sp.]HCA49228.1 (d)CMP kinase [Planctomycetaceae bacterium]|tara:strand:- start:47604 stop:48251 length:648 start_codon:yes stop_codon:yes gene_type:complete
MIVTIDGPAGAGKSTVARKLAAKLGFDFLDTGAMYRCVALSGSRQNVDWGDEAALGEIARSLPLEFDGARVLLGDEDVSAAIRTPEVTAIIHYAADNLMVREAMVDLQRKLAAEDNVVTEGRDQGTVAFPQAECKFFLSASAEERARRRVEQLRQNGKQASLEEVLEQQTVRDEQDEAREVGGLKAAEDALYVITDGMKPFEVVEHLERLVRIRM